MSYWRQLGGAYYISEWNGDPLNPGTDTLPYLHPADLGAVSIATQGIIGAGYYLGTWLGQRNLIADGIVFINLLEGITPNVCFFKDIIFLEVGMLGTSSTSSWRAENCVFIFKTSGGIIKKRTGSLFHIGNWFVGRITNLQGNLSSQTNWTNCSLINNGSIIDDGGGGAFVVDRFNYNFISKETTLVILAGTLNYMKNCMVNGKIQNGSGGTIYESKQLIDGSPRPDADPLVEDIATLTGWSDFYTNGNFSGDAKIIDIYSRTVDPTSDLLKKQNANGFIGGARPGKFVKFDSEDFIVSLTNIDTSNPNFIKVAGGSTFGQIRISGKVSDDLVTSDQVFPRTNFAFASKEAADSTYNNNVPDAYHTLATPDEKGFNPNRLTFEVRSSVLADANRSVSSDWDNGSAGIPGRYYLMEFGQPMIHHIIASVAYGNADLNALSSVLKVPFSYRSLDMIITLSNDRTS